MQDSIKMCRCEKGNIKLKQLWCFLLLCTKETLVMKLEKEGEVGQHDINSEINERDLK